jgi:2-iminobutanoate/2-iminopropanoate deaminase
LHLAAAMNHNPGNGTTQNRKRHNPETGTIWVNGKGVFSKGFQYWRNFMARDIIRTTNAPSSPPTYSQAVRAAGLVFVSGTGPHDPITGKIVGDTIQEQTRQCLENVSAILEAAGSSIERVVSATVIILEETDFAGMNEEWLKWFPTNPPARQGAKLPVRIPGLKVSIAAIAEA